MHTKEWQLDQPKDKEPNHTVGGYTLGLGDAIRQIQVTGPDSTKHDTDSISTIHILNGEPKDSQDDSRDDGNVRAPKSPAGARNNWKWNMVYGTDSPVGSDNEGHNEER
jgi:hypothetical protein